jgi:aldehyde dehydrogenase (NAD+)/betaine-aldehyde dehydrogenase
MVSFTGSTAAGIRVAELAAAGMKRTALELGGKSASVVLDGADLARAVKFTLASCLLNSGQTCNALTRLVVPRQHIGDVAELLRSAIAAYRIGDPLDPATRLGPLASNEQAERVRRTVAAARAAGVPVMAEGAMPEGLGGGYFVAPIVFGPVSDPASGLVQDEIFGPVLVVQPHEGEDNAVALANCTPYGLAAAVWAPDDETALRIARRLRAGQVDCNGAVFNPEAPFGGYGLSGIGRENGPLGVDGFLETKSVQMP